MHHWHTDTVAVVAVVAVVTVVAVVAVVTVVTVVGASERTPHTTGRERPRDDF